MMAVFRRAEGEQVNVFEVDEMYLFKQYFDGDEVFDRLKQYYNNQHYRFEVPPDDFENLRSFLTDHGYGLVVVDAIKEFVVVVEKYTTHPENIFQGVSHSAKRRRLQLLPDDRSSSSRTDRV